MAKLWRMMKDFLREMRSWRLHCGGELLFFVHCKYLYFIFRNLAGGDVVTASQLVNILVYVRQQIKMIDDLPVQDFMEAKFKFK